MSERPFMQLYVSDFVGDTLLLSTEHIGAYLLLLIALWNADGELPADEVKLARVARMSVKKWRTVAPELMPFFIIESGKLTHQRLTKELRKSERQSISRAAAGSKGGTANALKIKERTQANAKAPAAAGLKHARALPEPYRKKGENFSLKEEGAGEIQLDRWADEALFKACESILEITVPEYQQKKSFPRDIVAKARALTTGSGEHAA